MNKRKITPFYSGIYILVLALGIIETATFGILVLTKTLLLRTSVDIVCLIILLTAGLFLILVALYTLIRGFASGTYSIDTEGASTYIGKKTYQLYWKDCVEFGIARVTVNWGSSVAIVYGTKKLTSAYERDHFLKCRRKDYENTFYFQYSDEDALQELLYVLPEHAKAQLTAKVNRYPING